MPPALPDQGQLVEVRQRHFVVLEVAESGLPTDSSLEEAQRKQHLVTLSSVEDDALGEELQVVWELEPGLHIYEKMDLPHPKGFDDPVTLDCFLDAVRWGSVVSADSRAIQSPFRSGIDIEDYQLDPVVRAIQMPRVNLLVADDTGLGKTIEAGLVLQELIIRNRVRTVVIACPASLQIQWRDQMRDKFGLDFRIIDSDLFKELRRRRGIHRKVYRDKWWHYAEKRPEVYAIIAGVARVLVCSEVTKHLSFILVPSAWVFSANVDVFPWQGPCVFAQLQSALHDAWARSYSSFLETRLKYSPGNAFETYPFAPEDNTLGQTAVTFLDKRQDSLQHRDLCVTELSNLIHSPNVSGRDICGLRELHAEMDRVVADAYGWTDLDLGHDFHQTKQGIRFTVSESARREILDRLLALNHQCYKEEVEMGLHDKGAKSKSRSPRKKSKSDQEELF